MIEVYANGKKFSNWLTASVNRSLDHIAATFSLSLQPTGGLESFGMFPGDSVEIKCNGTKVLSGFVDKLSSSFSGGSHSVSVSGSEKTSDLADCCLESPLEWAEKDISGITGDICKAFGLSFSNSNGVEVGKPFKKFSADPGSKALETISKLCKERGILACSDGIGNVSLVRPDSCQRGDYLEQGKNLLSANADYSIVNRYSTYLVYGSGKAKSKVKATATDSEVERNRLIIIVDSNSTAKENVQARADWEKCSRIAKSMSVKCEVHGWECSSGIWSPGVICSICAPAIGINEMMDLLANSVTLSWSMESGEKTEISLVPPEVYAPQPESKKTKASKASKPGKADPWASIRKAVRG